MEGRRQLRMYRAPRPGLEVTAGEAGAGGSALPAAWGGGGMKGGGTSEPPPPLRALRGRPAPAAPRPGASVRGEQP